MTTNKGLTYVRPNCPNGPYGISVRDNMTIEQQQLELIKAQALRVWLNNGKPIHAGEAVSVVLNKKDVPSVSSPPARETEEERNERIMRITREMSAG